MSPVEFKKTLCRPVDFEGQEPHVCLVVLLTCKSDPHPLFFQKHLLLGLDSFQF